MYYIHGRRLRGGLGERSPQKSLGGGTPMYPPPNISRSCVSESTNYELSKKRGVIKELFFRSRRFLVKKGPYTHVYVMHHIISLYITLETGKT